ncbi:HAD family hydrolase [Blastochloris sulfoviridis]|uniref:phosphoglycolate phosphatase n=1 Tax=Blastochloris sulfoviridis TaxID=50712 RepID=A0A5M6HT72_9HYPH|nr:HAD-IA family hydrolase [Blastochloris sulfoviridis]KAA5599174.1 HAD family hydrolase [Blastochloris sulfoviridis]
MSKKVLITDLDNTLFDWVDVWYSCFSAMLQEICDISGLSADELKPEIRKVHQRHGTSEYSFLIEELPLLKQFFPDKDLLEVFRPAIERYRAERARTLRLYSGVADTLLIVKGSGALIIGYTESMAFYSNYRVRKLGLDGVIDKIFSPKDHDIPKALSREDIRKYPSSRYEFRYTQHHHTPAGSLKPDPDVLKEIVGTLGVGVSECVYVGDSLHKDIAMAQDAGVMDVYAEYGKAQHTSAYQLLREVTHWSDADVEREKRITTRDVKPGITLRSSFREIIEHVEFRSWDGSRPTQGSDRNLESCY